VGKPNRAASRAILSKYFRDDLPYAPDAGATPDAARENLIDSALSRLFSPNGDGDVATITFRDGAKQTVRIHQLISGAILAKVENDAAMRACLREIDTGENGIRLDDVYSAINDAIDNAANLLTPKNCSRYLSDLPQDVDVVSVEPIKRKPAQVNHYLRVA
jgi:hypothetical protein